jgi:hypothetical protein
MHLAYGKISDINITDQRVILKGQWKWFYKIQYSFSCILNAEIAGNICFRKMKRRTAECGIIKVYTTAFVLEVGLRRLQHFLRNVLYRPDTAHNYHREAYCAEKIIDLTTLSFVLLLKYEMVWTRERLEHDWFTPKELWHTFYSKALVDFFHLYRKISCLTGPTVKHYDTLIYSISLN